MLASASNLKFDILYFVRVYYVRQQSCTYEVWDHHTWHQVFLSRIFYGSQNHGLHSHDLTSCLAHNIAFSHKLSYSLEIPAVNPPQLSFQKPARRAKMEAKGKTRLECSAPSALLQRKPAQPLNASHQKRGSGLCALLHIFAAQTSGPPPVLALWVKLQHSTSQQLTLQSSQPHESAVWHYG